MQTTRQSKVARVIQKELSNIFQKEGHIFSKTNVMISVTIVRISPDLSYCKVFLSLFPTKEKDIALENIKKAQKQIRYILGKIVRHQLRIVPELDFYLDDSLDYIDNIDSLLKK